MSKYSPYHAWGSSGLLLLALLFWAWQIQLPWLGAVLAVLLLAVWSWGKRFHFDQHSCHQIGDLCVLIALGIFSFYWLDSKASKAIFPTLRLLPVALFPLLLMQFLHEKKQVPSSVWLVMRRKLLAVKWVNIMPVFVLLCLFSAGAAEQKNIAYFIGLLGIVLGLMLLQRWREGLRQKSVLVLLFVMVAGMAFVGQLGLVALQNKLEMSIDQWLKGQFDHSQNSTAIGRVGRLKLSDSIAFRVQPLGDVTPPLLLQTGSYQRYAHGQWFAAAREDEEVSFDGETWTLRQQDDEPAYQLRFFQTWENKHEILSIPLQSVAIRGLPANTLTIKQGGSVELTPAKPFAAFTVAVAKQGDVLSAVHRGDLSIAKGEAKAVAWVAKSLDLYQIKHDAGEKAVLAAIHGYFQQHYTYSTWLQPTADEASPLADFLLRSHAGHCEYFATATVLLLREVGIAARYAVGYAMQEWDGEHDYYVVRGRDAHAWALAWVDDAWRNVDNTPPDWFAQEDADRDILQGIKDMFSAWGLAIQRWRYAEGEDETIWWMAALLVLFSFLAWRILRRVKVEKKLERGAEGTPSEVSGWLLLEQELIAAGLLRFSGETLKTWLHRVEKDELLGLVDSYYRVRFTQESMSHGDRDDLEREVEAYRLRFIREQGEKGVDA